MHRISLTQTSLVPRPEEEEKGPGFSRSHMHLIAVEFHHLRILLMYFRTLVTPILILNVTLSECRIQGSLIHGFVLGAPDTRLSSRQGEQKVHGKVCFGEFCRR